MTEESSNSSVPENIPEKIVETLSTESELSEPTKFDQNEKSIEIQRLRNHYGLNMTEESSNSSVPENIPEKIVETFTTESELTEPTKFDQNKKNIEIKRFGNHHGLKMTEESSNSSVPENIPEKIVETFTTESELSEPTKFDKNEKNIEINRFGNHHGLNMTEESSNSSVPENISEKIVETFTTELTDPTKFDQHKKNIENTQKLVQEKDTRPELATEDDYETTTECDTVTEEDDATTIEEDDEELEEVTVSDIPTTETIPLGDILSSKEETKNTDKGDTISEEDVPILKDNVVVAENHLIVKGDNIMQEIHSLVDKSTITLVPKSTPSMKIIKGRLVCIVGPDHSLGLVQEPWPKDVKLYQPYEVEQILLPDNANCLAVQAFLRMCELDFEVVSRANAEFMSPSGKVPFIKCGAFIVSELEGIVQFVNNKGISLTTNMESEQKSDMRAYMSLVHNVLENAELYLCWCDKETYNEVTKPRNGSVYPWPLNYFQTWSKKSTVCKRLKMMGWYSKTLEDVYQEVENCCQALTDRLEGKEYFFGKKYTEMDAIVYGHIYSILTISLPADNNRLAYLIQQYEKLTDHCRRIHKQVMKQDHIFVVTKYSRIIDSGNDSETENNLISETDDLQEVADYEDIDTESSIAC